MRHFSEHDINYSCQSVKNLIKLAENSSAPSFEGTVIKQIQFWNPMIQNIFASLKLLYQ